MSPQKWQQKGHSRFEIYLRTGVILPVSEAPLALKYNPWHDIEDGRFTRAGMGKNVPPRFGGFGGGRFDGGGASGSWEATEESKPRPKPARPDPNVNSTPVTRRAAKPQRDDSIPSARSKSPIVETIRSNGYAFGVDAQFRTQQVTGTLTLGPRAPRSRSLQSGAGRPDRRSSDDGGHYIAARFNGPREKFNHFAQDANFNRGQYRALEDRWAKAIANGEKVLVDIRPRYRGSSKRPDAIYVTWTIGKESGKIRLVNERGG